MPKYTLHIFNTSRHIVKTLDTKFGGTKLLDNKLNWEENYDMINAKAFDKLSDCAGS